MKSQDQKRIVFNFIKKRDLFTINSLENNNFRILIEYFEKKIILCLG